MTDQDPSQTREANVMPHANTHIKGYELHISNVATAFNHLKNVEAYNKEAHVMGVWSCDMFITIIGYESPFKRGPTTASKYTGVQM